MTQQNEEARQDTWPEPKDFTFRCPFCQGLVTVLIEINGFRPADDDKWTVFFNSQMTNHECRPR